MASGYAAILVKVGVDVTNLITVAMSLSAFSQYGKLPAWLIN